MGKLFAGLSTEGTEKTEDRIGGGRHVFNTDIYEAKVKLAFAGKWDSGSQFVTVIFDVDGQEYEETITITNKEGKPFYVKDGKKNQLPGFVTINELCQVITGNELNEQETEERQIEVWSSEESKKVRQARDVLVDLVGQDVLIALRKTVQPKQKKNDNGDYVDTDEDVTINELVKSFHVGTRCTVGEIVKAKEAGKQPEANFIDAWREKWKDSVYNKRKGGGNTSSGSAGAPPKASGSTEKPKSSLFG
jgi:hypothetical protein